MPNIPATTFADGAAISASTFQDAVYLPDATTPESYEVINGWLDSANMDSTFEVTRRMVQRRQLVEARQVGSSMPLDYFSDLFNGRSYAADGTTTSDSAGSFVPIPGAQITFYVGASKPALMLFNWSITWENDLTAAGASPIRFGFNGRVLTTDTAARRVVPRSVYPNVTFTHRDNRFANHWTGFHADLPGDSGVTVNAWNTAGLFIASQAAQVRVRNRRIGYFIIR